MLRRSVPVHVFLLAFLISGVGSLPAAAQKSAQKKQTATKKSAPVRKKGSKEATVPAKKNVKKGSAASTGSSSKGKGKNNGAGNNEPKTAAEARRRHEETTKEIRQTREQIKANEAEVKKNLSELTKLTDEITAGKKKVGDATARVETLNRRIDTLTNEISRNQAELEKLRGEYLKAIKRIRARKHNNSFLAFLFSSNDFNQALRRMRYLRKFSNWKDRQSAEISERTSLLREQTDRLAASRESQKKALALQVTAQNELQQRYTRQDALVAELRRNGEALKTHLSQKQAEANALNARVASLIAEEQRKAESERRAREEQARREAEAKAAREAQAREERERKANEAEAQRQREEQLAKNVADKKGTEGDVKIAAAPVKMKDKKETKEKDKKKDTRKEEAKKENKKDQRQESASSKGSYAEARKRPPRSSGSAPAKSSTPSAVSSPSPAPSTGGKSFESMKGALPRPVSGHFRITGKFGRHSLPDLPDVQYDNPGIDAEVAPGASAQAVFAGKVSGVYMIPGYSTVVIVSHGNYYTVYGNIAAASVKVGDTVSQGTNLGKLAPGEDDSAHSSIHFEVWKNRDKLDPSVWIR